jgi:hypothetical protein
VVITPKSSSNSPSFVGASAPTVADARTRRQQQWALWRAAGIVVGSGLIWLTLLLLPTDFFDQGRAVCLSRVLFDRECPGCGMTRACQHALHFDFASAWHYNPRWVIVLPLLAFLWGREVWILLHRLGWLKRRSD